MNRLGTRATRVELPDGDVRRREGGTTAPALEWTIDDVPLREVVSDHGSIPVLTRGVGPGHRRESLLRLRGDRTDLPTFEPRFERSWFDRLFGLRGIPYAPYGPAFEDGRVVLLECACGDLDCPTLSTEVVVADEHVEWRDVGWQVTYEPFNGPTGALFTARFDRAQYLAVVDELLSEQWWRLENEPEP